MRESFESASLRSSGVLRSSFPSRRRPSVSESDQVKVVAVDGQGIPTRVCSAGRGPVRLMTDPWIENKPFTLTRAQWFAIFGETA